MIDATDTGRSAFGHRSTLNFGSYVPFVNIYFNRITYWIDLQKQMIETRQWYAVVQIEKNNLS